MRILIEEAAHEHKTVTLRTRRGITASRWSLLPWRDGVVPVALEGMALNVEGSHFGIGDLNSFRVEALVDVAGDGEAGIGGGGDAPALPARLEIFNELVHGADQHVRALEN